MSFAKVRSVPIANITNAVIYARYSSEKQTENSIDGQMRECKKYCDFHGYNIIGSYIDRASSGTNDNRPEFQQMIEDSAKQQFAFIIVYRFDRFARNRFDSAIYKKKLEQNGVKVISVSENIGNGDESIILESIYEAMDEAYSRRLSKITKRGMQETARKGLWTGGIVPLGYKVEDRKLVIDEKEAPAVRLIFEEYAKGTTKKQIADLLNEAGYRTKQGNLFNYANFTTIMRNKMYYGNYNMGEIKRSCPAIVTEELFNKVQELEQRNKKCFGRKVSETFFALGGKIFCGYCGAAMIGDSGTSRNGEKHFYYTCGKRKKHRNCIKKSERKDFLEWYICEQTVLRVLTPKRINEIAEKIVKLTEADMNGSQTEDLKKALKTVDKEFNDAVDALIKTNSDKAIARINEKIEELEKQKSAIEVQLAKLQLREEYQITPQEIKSFLYGFKTGDLLDEEFQRKLINSLINCVYLFDDKIVIYYNIKGAKPIEHTEMISDIEKLSEQNCSDSLSNGSPCWT